MYPLLDLLVDAWTLERLILGSEHLIDLVGCILADNAGQNLAGHGVLVALDVAVQFIVHHLLPLGGLLQQLLALLPHLGIGDAGHLHPDVGKFMHRRLGIEVVLVKDDPAACSETVHDTAAGAKYLYLLLGTLGTHLLGIHLRQFVKEVLLLQAGDIVFTQGLLQSGQHHVADATVQARLAHDLADTFGQRVVAADGFVQPFLHGLVFQ